ncbi:MAG: FAD-binding oxidoreductase [Pseudomonadota bacterium]
MNQPNQFDAIVVGAGIVGSTTAFTLAESGKRTALVESGQIGEGTSNNSFAWINATSKTSHDDYHRLNALGADGYRRFAQRFGEATIGLHPIGMLQWIDARDTDAEAELGARLKTLQRLDYPVRPVGLAELRAMEPHVQFGDNAAGLFALADAWLDTQTFIPFIVGEFQRLGGEVFERTPARHLSFDETGQVEGLKVDGAELCAPHVIVASGPNVPELLSELTDYDAYRQRFPVRRGPGLLVLTPSIAPYQFARHILYTDSPHHFHIRPAPGGGLLLGADDTDGLVDERGEREAMREGARQLLERARTYLPQFVGAACLDECELKLGIRPVPQDGLSILGPMPGAKGLHLAVTHSGITLAPAIGSLLTQTVVDGEPPDTLSPFLFDRFQIQP